MVDIISLTILKFAVLHNWKSFYEVDESTDITQIFNNGVVQDIPAITAVFWIRIITWVFHSIAS